MASFVTAGSEDVNVMHLNGLFVIAMKELLKKNKPTSALTIEDFTNVYSEIIKGNVGMHNYFEEKLNEANHKLEEAHDEIKSLKEASKSQGDELIKVKKELVSTKLELERSQQLPTEIPSSFVVSKNLQKVVTRIGRLLLSRP